MAPTPQSHPWGHGLSIAVRYTEAVILWELSWLQIAL